ncbi:MAG: serine/threonine-protein phosphatase [Chromatiaceae bacterium]|nr:MAG: serine/threonine-protein phosphatase [Chromatiaceae bacterium]
MTNTGKLRRVNEDAFLIHPSQPLWLVADGMGGHARGDLASTGIVRAFDRLALPERLSDCADLVEQTLLEINAGLCRLAAAEGGGETIGSTVVVLLARRGLMLYLWAGDSRLYRWRGGQLEQLTQDHSQVQEMVAEGLLRRDQAESHPAANIVTRAVGGSEDLFLDLDYRPVAVGDRFLLCSDGLTKELPEPEIAAILGAHGDAVSLCRALLERVMATPARDNVTLVVAIAGADPAAARAR